jgi:hypothetical protein
LLAIPESVDDAGDDAEIVLGLHRRAGVGKRGAQIVTADPDSQRPGEVALESPTKGLGEFCHRSTQVIGSGEGNRTVHQTDASQKVNEDPGISILRRIEHRSDETAQHIAAMFSAKHVARASIAEIDDHSPARVEVDKAVGIHSVKADALL